MRRLALLDRRTGKRERMREGRIAIAVSKKSKFSPSLKMSKSYPNDNGHADYVDVSSDQGSTLDTNADYDVNSDHGGNLDWNENGDFADSDSNATLDPNNSDGSTNPSPNGNANSNGNNNPYSNGQSNSNSNNNPSPNSNNNSSNSKGNQNPSGNSNDQSNSNSNNNPNSNSSNNNSNSNSNTNSPSQSGTSNNNNNSPPNSGNGGNNSNSTSPSSPPQQHNNNNNTSYPSPPKGSGRPMFSPQRPALSDGRSSASKSSSSVKTGLLAGVLVGAGMLFMLLIILVVYFCKKRRKKKEQIIASMKYFPDDQKGAAQQQYYSNNVQNNGPWRASPSPSPGPGHGPGYQHQQDMKTGNYTGGSGMPLTEHWGPIMPPPPPPNMMTSDMGAGPYSSGPAGPILPPPPPPSIGFNKSTFTYDELSAATNGFSQANLIGQGGFGFVHKGVLPNGKEIAVKSLKSGSRQGEREFQAEVEIISRVHHRHLVSLVGYCIAGSQRMLVYEFILNKTLEYHLHGKDRPVMDFPTRMKIALGAARGLAYLHEDCHPRIIHRDIKGANILLDDSFETKVADFGLAKLSNDNFTHVSTRIMGTFGYMAPEYAASGKLTEKSDVFSFGIMLLELVTGKRPIDNTSDEEENLVDWARPLIPRAIEEGVFEGLADPRLEGKFDAQQMKRLIACAGAAIRHSGKARPKMSQIVRALEGDMSLDALYERPKPEAPSGGGSSDYDNIDTSKFSKTGHDSTGYSSSDTESGSSMPRRSPGRGYH